MKDRLPSVRAAGNRVIDLISPGAHETFFLREKSVEVRVLTKIRSRMFGIALTAIFAMGSSTAYAACNSDKDLLAYNMRQLQTDLMVASLNCGLHDEYNAFIDRFNAELTRSGKHLKADFSKRFGGDAKALLNAYVTTLANMSSIDSIKAGRGYCADSTQSFATVMSLAPTAIEDFADGWWDASREVPDTDCRYDIHIASTN